MSTDFSVLKSQFDSLDIAPVDNSQIVELADFLKSSLRPDTNWSLTDEYPKMFHSDNYRNLWVARDNQRIIAHAGLQIGFVKTTIGIFKVAGIGSVVTASEYQRRGISSRLLEKLLLSALNEQCDFAVLWTDRFDFYRRFGFELAGYEISYQIPPLMNGSQPAGKIIKGKQVDPSSLLKLYSQHRIGHIRNQRDMELALKIPGCDLYTLWSPSSELMAYAVVGRGADLYGYAHEWAGQVSALVPLFEFIASDRQTNLTVLVPEYAQNLRRVFDAKSYSSYQGHLGMFRPLALNNLFFKLRRKARFIGLDIDFSLQDSQVHLHYRSRDIVFNSMAQFSRFVFGPAVNEVIDSLAPNEQRELRQIFPIEFWIWGWDSV